jgi:hypothetical protein
VPTRFRLLHNTNLGIATLLGLDKIPWSLGGVGRACHSKILSRRAGCREMGWALYTTRDRPSTAELKLRRLDSRLSWSYIISLAQNIYIHVQEQNVAPMRIEDDIADYLERRASRFCKVWKASIHCMQERT